MNTFDPQGLKAFVLGYVSQRLISRGRSAPETLNDDCDLMLSGLTDSIGMLELLSAFQDHCGRDIDFDALDPELMTVVGPLCDFVASQMNEE